MPKNTEKQEQEEHFEEVEDVGAPLVSWETFERIPHERSKSWYIIASVIGAALLIYAVLTGNFLFAIIILMAGIILVMNGIRHPERIEVHITDLGIVVDNTFHDYKDIKEFALVYEPPMIKTLYVDFNSAFRPMVSIQLDEADPNIIRETLLPYVYENLEREDETLTDLLRRVYKL